MPTSGVAMGAGAYLLWGLFPIFFHALAPAGAFEVLAHRILWSLLTCLLLVLVSRSGTLLVAVCANRRTLATLGFAAATIAVNWLVYVHTVFADNVVEAALGYYINPLVTVVLGVIVLSERLRPLQWVACGLGVAAVAVLTVGYGRPPWIAFVLALTFGMYSLAKNRVGRSVGALHTLTVETAILAGPALAMVIWLQVHGPATFIGAGAGHTLLLASTGVVTSIPLLLFAGAASRIPLSMVGLLQYLTPSAQLLIGVLVFDEPMPPARWAGFVLIWMALVVFSVDLLRRQPVPRADGGATHATPG
jgi:chloramphenicol-sensitive protein RarD